MTTQEFLNQYLGQGVDFDGYYGDQCVDEVQFYNRDVIGAPSLTGNAADIWNTYPQDFYDRIDNAPDNFPQFGDIVIWSGNLNGGPGHIAIAIAGNVNTFLSLDQNWVKGDPCKGVNHDYGNVLGFLRPKNASNLQAEYDQCRIDRDQHWNDLQAEIKKNQDLQNQLTVLNQQFDDYRTLHPVSTPPPQVITENQPTPVSATPDPKPAETVNTNPIDVPTNTSSSNTSSHHWYDFLLAWFNRK